jgi:integrase
VLGKDKDRPKTNEVRTVELNPRALAVLKRQFALREAYANAGMIDHDLVFFRADGQPIRSLKYVYMRWRYVVEVLGVRYREPYNARHSCVSWHLMIGKNLMWCARQHGHSVQVMLEMYGRWIEGSTDADIEAIRESMRAGATADQVHGAPAIPADPRAGATKVPPGAASGGWGRLSWRKIRHLNRNIGGADGTRRRGHRLRNQ